MFLRTSPLLARLRRQWRPFCTVHDARHARLTVRSALTDWQRRFARELVAEPLSSIKHILSAVIQCPWDQVDKCDLALTDAQMERLETMCLCRLQRMPVQYIVGEWDFCELTLRLHPPVFIPRPETEQLVQLACDRLEQLSREAAGRITVLELCCGSGAVSNTLLHRFPNVECVAVDVCELACRLTAENAARHGVNDRLRVVRANIHDNLQCRRLSETIATQCSLVLANPPYLSHEQMHRLPPEILHYEDIGALDGGSDGLAVIRRVLAVTGEWLADDGRLLIEVDSAHSPHVRRIVQQCAGRQRLRFERVHEDFAGHERFVELHMVPCP